MNTGAKLVAALDGKTKTSVAHEAHATAIDRLESLAISVRAAFAELERAHEQLQKCGVTTEVELRFPLNEAWATYRVKEFTKREGRGENRR